MAIAGVVTRDQHLGIEIGKTVEEPVELDGPVALDARIGRAPRAVVPDEAVDHTITELVGVVEHVIRDVELRRHPSGVFGVGHCAAPRRRSLPVRPRPQLEGDPHDVVTRFSHQRRRHR